jgi:choline-sulfatase
VKQVVGLKQPPAREPWMSRPLQEFTARPEPDRFVISQYHDGGAPTGFYMLRYRQWKYVHYAGRDADQLFDLSADARELNDLGRSAMHERERETLRTLLGHVLDPDTVNADRRLQTSRRLLPGWAARTQSGRWPVSAIRR